MARRQESIRPAAGLKEASVGPTVVHPMLYFEPAAFRGLNQSAAQRRRLLDSRTRLLDRDDTPPGVEERSDFWLRRLHRRGPGPRR